MSTELANNDLTNLLADCGIEVRNDAELSAVDTGFIPAMRLIIKSSPLTDAGFPVNHFGIAYSADDVQDAGSQVEGYLVNYRHKAVSGLQDKNIKTVYDKESPEYKAIADQVGVMNSGCAAGPEVLVYVPERDELVTFHFGSKSLGYAWNGCAKHVAKGTRVTFSAKKVDSGPKPYFVAEIKESAVKVHLSALLTDALKDKMRAVNQKFIDAKPYDKAANAVAAKAETR